MDGFVPGPVFGEHGSAILGRNFFVVFSDKETAIKTLQRIIFELFESYSSDPHSNERIVNLKCCDDGDLIYCLKSGREEVDQTISVSTFKNKKTLVQIKIMLPDGEPIKRNVMIAAMLEKSAIALAMCPAR